MKLVARALLILIIVSIVSLSFWHYWQQKTSAAALSTGDADKVDTLEELYAAIEKVDQGFQSMRYIMETEEQFLQEEPVRYKITAVQMGNKLRYETDNGFVIGYNGQQVWLHNKNENSTVVAEASGMSPDKLGAMNGVKWLRSTFGTDPGNFDAYSDPGYYHLNNFRASKGPHHLVQIDKKTLQLVECRTFLSNGSVVISRVIDLEVNPKGITEEAFHPLPGTLNPQEAHLLWAQLGSSAISIEDFDLAREFFEKAVASDPPPDLKMFYLIQIGESYAAQRQVDKALEYYRAAAAVEDIGLENVAFAKHYEGCALVNLGKYQEGINVLESSLSTGKQPLAAETYEMLGLAYYRLGNKEKARENLQASLSITRDGSRRERISRYLDRLANTG